MVEKAEYRFVLQKCAHCGKIFPAIYWYKENRLEAFGELPCKCWEGRNGFDAIGEGAMPFVKWMELQRQLRQQSAGQVN